MSISNAILSGNLMNAKEQIFNRLNEIAGKMIDTVKIDYSKVLFSEDFDANKFKGKTDMDMVRKGENEDENENDAASGDDDDNDNDDDDDDDDEKPSKSTKAGEGVTINVNEQELNELSPIKLGRYVNSAANRAAISSMQYGEEDDLKKKNNYYKIASKRLKGIEAAMRKMAGPKTSNWQTKNNS